MTLKKYSSTVPHYQRFLYLILGLLLLLCSPASQSAAQEPSQPPVERSGNFEAPAREPVILSTQATSTIGAQTTLEIPPAADTYIASNQPNQNFGSTDGLFLGYNLGLNTGAERILLQFDVLAALPPNVQINSARLRLYLNFSTPSADVPMATVLRRLAAPWGESTVTWATEPAWGGIRADANISSSLGWYEWDMTSLVADWAKGVHPNYGVEIIGDEHVQTRERVFYARETTTPFYPRLVVDYTTGPIDDTPPQVSVDPLPQFTLTRDFSVSWSGSDGGSQPTGIAYYDIQYRIDHGDWQTWLVDYTETQAQFTGAEDGRLYQFRARGVDNAGNAEPFGEAEAETTINISPPRTVVDPLPLLMKSTQFIVSWTGVDGANGAGIYCYDVQYRYEGGPWTLWQGCTQATSALFTSFGDGRYEFEARAVDNLGFLEAFKDQAEAVTIVDLQPPFIELKHVYLPYIVK